MISTNNVTLNFAGRVLFEKVSLKFIPGNCYGLIGANGAGKSTFLKILSGEIDNHNGDVIVSEGQRISTLKQDHFAYEDEEALQVVVMGDTALAAVMKERDEIYSKEDFTDEDGIRSAELEEKLEEMGGYEAEANAGKLLSNLGLPADLHNQKMSDLTEGQRVKVLLAQALFGDPDILLLDEPTNGLDVHAVRWLENFLGNYEKTVIVVSHDRHFLNSVCTHMADIDYGKISLFVGNYDFWWESSQLLRKLEKEQKKKAEEKANELKTFIARFSANASKSKQATSRKKALDKLDLDSLKPSTRKFPYIDFKMDNPPGKQILKVENLSKSREDKKLLDNVSFQLYTGEKVAITGDELSVTALFELLSGNEEPDGGKFEWGQTTSLSYFEADHTSYFEGQSSNLIDWLRQYSTDADEAFLRGFLGRMLFSGDEVNKKVSVLSGGEKVRMMLSKMMMTGANCLLLDHPTSHLDLESIQALNKGMEKFGGNILFASHDQQLLQTIADRVFEIKAGQLTVFDMSYEEYVEKQETALAR